MGESDVDARIIVYHYMSVLTPKLAEKFKKEVNVSGDLLPGSPQLSDIVKQFKDRTSDNDMSKEVKKRKCVDDETVGLHKKPKNEELFSSKPSDKIAHPIERKRIFIRNVGKDSVYEDFQESVEKFGKVSDFSNPGRGFCFLTFSEGKSAKACVTALNKTEIAGKTVLMNLAREESETESTIGEDCKLFVHGVSQDIDEDDIKAKFETFGNVIDSFNPGKGFAFVTFSLAEEAAAAAEGLNGKEAFGNIINVNVSKPKVKSPAVEKKDLKIKKSKKEKKEGVRLFVNNVSQDTSQEELKTAFEAYGTVTDAYNPAKGFAFVNFATENEANAAIEGLSGKEICGKIIECNIARFKKKAQKGRAKS